MSSVGTLNEALACHVDEGGCAEGSLQANGVLREQGQERGGDGKVGRPYFVGQKTNNSYIFEQRL